MYTAAKILGAKLRMARGTTPLAVFFTALFSVFFTVLVVLSTPVAAAFPLQDDQTPGSMALAYRRQSKVWTRFDAGAVDGKIVSYPPGTARLDRRLDALAIGGFDAVLGRFGIRVNLKSEYSKRRQGEEDGPPSYVDETQLVYRPSVDLSFLTDKGLEIFGGAQATRHEAFDQNVEAGVVHSKTRFARATLVTRRFGVVRRAGAWAGGFYYVFGSEGERSFEKTASDGSILEGVDVIYEPSRVAVFGEFNAASLFWDFEMSFIQARGLGPKDERNHSIYTDHFEARIGAYLPIGTELGLKTSAAHRTLSYANHAYVSLDTMPVSVVKLLSVFGDLKRDHAFFGLVYGVGNDGQSLPEFNARYELQAGALTTGFSLAF